MLLLQFRPHIWDTVGQLRLKSRLRRNIKSNSSKVLSINLKHTLEVMGDSTWILGFYLPDNIPSQPNINCLLLKIYSTRYPIWHQLRDIKQRQVSQMLLRSLITEFLNHLILIFLKFKWVWKNLLLEEDMEEEKLNSFSQTNLIKKI